MAHQLHGRIAVVGWVALIMSGSAVPPVSFGALHDETKVPGIVNSGFEEQDDRGGPAGWVFPPMLEKAGYRMRVEAENALAGKKCVLLDATAVEPRGGRFGNLMQSIDATSFRGKQVRFRAAVRTADLSADGRAQLWFRVDRASPDGQNRVGAFDNMQDRPIRGGQWNHYEIVGPLLLYVLLKSL